MCREGLKKAVLHTGRKITININMARIIKKLCVPLHHSPHVFCIKPNHQPSAPGRRPLLLVRTVFHHSKHTMNSRIVSGELEVGRYI